MKRFLILGLLTLFFGREAYPESMSLPERPKDAPGGELFAKSIADLSPREREQRIEAEILDGNVPNALRRFVAVHIAHEIDGRPVRATFYAAPDYLSVGTNADYFLTPLTPYTAQRIADRLRCVLPTRLMADEIYRHATVRLTPAPIPPSSAMTTVSVFLRHNEAIRGQRPQGVTAALTAGHKKDLVISPRLASTPGKVAIYGWHQAVGRPIQPLYLGHTAAWADYSHGVRLVESRMLVDGRPTTVQAVLADPKLCVLLSDEGPVSQPRYDLKEFPVLPSPELGEQNVTMKPDPGVRIVVNEPKSMSPAKPLELVIYALPNGNTIEQTIGKRIKPTEDWHFDIQHIGAQTRFLRERRKDRDIVVAYVENDMKSWPAWRGKNGDDRLPAIVDAVKERYRDRKVTVTLNGHSGGGSFVLGYLGCFPDVPADVDRIAFLDSDYAYTTDRHAAMLTRWLRAGGHYLCVLAYNDAIALLNGKTFVSAAGGTWGRSHLMQTDLAQTFEFARQEAGEIERLTALNCRITFLFHPNPDRKILHTVQVERNGFIESMLSGTELEEQGYRYYGERAYGDLIAGG